MDYKPMLDLAIEAVKQAEKIILKYYGGEVQTEYKSDNSPVTIADKEAEKVIKDVIKNKSPDHSFLGEESGKESTTSEFLWIIDPIDGTKNFTRGIPLFATQIALFHKNIPVVGLSYNPILKELFTASKGSGTFLNGEKVNVSNVNSISKAYTTFGGLKYFTKNNLEKKIEEIATKSYYSRGIGDAWSYHLLARGAMDIMIEAETKIWDIAAVSVIIEESGGKVTDLKGNNISPNTTSIIATNGKVHEEVLAIFNK
ncbi:MAG: inositol monophosphatase family protein [Patescibacteria group bacterium]